MTCEVKRHSKCTLFFFFLQSCLFFLQYRCAGSQWNTRATTVFSPFITSPASVLFKELDSSCVWRPGAKSYTFVLRVCACVWVWIRMNVSIGATDIFFKIAIHSFVLWCSALFFFFCFSFFFVFLPSFFFRFDCFCVHFFALIAFAVFFFGFFLCMCVCMLKGAQHASTVNRQNGLYKSHETTRWAGTKQY